MKTLARVASATLAALAAAATQGCFLVVDFEDPAGAGGSGASGTSASSASSPTGTGGAPPASSSSQGAGEPVTTSTGPGGGACPAECVETCARAHKLETDLQSFVYAPQPRVRFDASPGGAFAFAARLEAFVDGAPRPLCAADARATTIVRAPTTGDPAFSPLERALCFNDAAPGAPRWDVTSISARAQGNGVVVGAAVTDGGVIGLAAPPITLTATAASPGGVVGVVAEFGSTGLAGFELSTSDAGAVVSVDGVFARGTDGLFATGRFTGSLVARPLGTAGLPYEALVLGEPTSKSRAYVVRTPSPGAAPVADTTIVFDATPAALRSIALGVLGGERAVALRVAGAGQLTARAGKATVLAPTPVEAESVVIVRGLSGGSELDAKLVIPQPVLFGNQPTTARVLFTGGSPERVVVAWRARETSAELPGDDDAQGSMPVTVSVHELVDDELVLRHERRFEPSAPGPAPVFAITHAALVGDELVVTGFSTGALVARTTLAPVGAPTSDFELAITEGGAATDAPFGFALGLDAACGARTSLSFFGAAGTAHAAHGVFADAGANARVLAIPRGATPSPVGESALVYREVAP